MLILEFLFLLLILYIGSRVGGIGLGTISGIGLLIEVLVFKQPPSSPPVKVILIILAVVSCAATLEACGGLKYMLQITERFLRKHPKQIIFFGPIATWLLTVMLGTGHAMYSIMPIISEIALKNKIRPERPCAAASVAAQLAITGSPLSAAVAYALTQISSISSSISLFSILIVTTSSTFVGVLMVSFYSMFRGKELEKDPEYQRRLQDPNFQDMLTNTKATTLNDTLPKEAKLGVLIFLLAIVLIVILAIFKDLRVITEGSKAVDMGTIIQMVMLAFAGIILLATKTKVTQVTSGLVFKAGLSAAIAIYGIGWMSNTYFQYAMPTIKPYIVTMVHAYPWMFAFAMFLVSVLVNSQGATLIMMLPIGISLGLHPALLIGILPSCYGYFFLPNYPSDIATINFDLTGTTKIGKFYFNHSFMIPGLVGVITACLIGCFLSSIIF